MIHHRDTENAEPSDVALTRQIVGAAIEVHRQLGPGLLESSYQKCLEHELTLRRLGFKSQQSVALSYKGLHLGDCYRVDFLVEHRVVVEVKAVEELQPIHRAQLLTYLRLLRVKVGLLLNFSAETLVKGIVRVVNGY